MRRRARAQPGQGAPDSTQRLSRPMNSEWGMRIAVRLSPGDHAHNANGSYDMNVTSARSRRLPLVAGFLRSRQSCAGDFPAQASASGASAQLGAPGTPDATSLADLWQLMQAGVLVPRPDARATRGTCVFPTSPINGASR